MTIQPTLLVIEDDPAQLADYAAKFKALGYAVETAAAAEEGIALIGRKQFDLILTDNMLPGMTGLCSIPELAKRSAARIFLMTSHPSLESEKDALLLGATAYFKKPLAFQQVHRQFQNSIGGSPSIRAAGHGSDLGADAS